MSSRGRPEREQIQPVASNSFFFRRKATERYHFPWHQHGEVELTLAVNGFGQRFVGDAVDAFTAPEVVIIGPDTPHTWIYDESCRQVETIVIQFPPALFATGLPEHHRLGPFVTRARRGLLARGATHDAVAGRMLELVACIDPLERLGLLTAILARLSHPTADIAPLARLMPDRTPDPRLDRVVDHIHTHATGTLGPRDLADLAGMHPAAFSRWFHRRMGKTCVHYLAEVRVSLACRQLLLDTRPVLDVALASGFANLASFNRWFRRLRRQTPTAYRKNAPTA